MMCLSIIYSCCASITWSDSLNVRLIGARTFGTCRAVASSFFDGHSYSIIGCGWGIMVLNVDNASNPIKTGELQMPGQVQKIKALGSMVYVACADKGLRIIDISAPSLPVEVGSYDTDGTTVDIALNGQFACLADGNSIRLVNISDPTQPTEAGNYSCVANAIDVNGHFAYVVSHTGSDNCLRIIDIHDPLNPIQTGIHHTTNIAEDVAVDGTIAYVADNYDGLRVIDVSDSSQPHEIGYNDSIYCVQNVEVNNNYIYTINGYLGEFQTFRLAANSHPVLVSSVRSTQFAWDIEVVGPYAYLADNGGLSIFDITDTALPHLINYYRTPAAARDVQARDGYAYVCDYYSGVRILDISNPRVPMDLSFATNPRWADYLALSDSNLLYTTGDSGFSVIDISDPVVPIKLGGCNVRGQIAPAGDYAYVTVDQCFQVVDVSDPVHPSLVNTISTPDHPQRAIVRDTLLFISCAPDIDLLNVHYYGGLRVYNITNPILPVEVGYLNTVPAEVTGLDIYGDVAYLSKDGFFAVDITNPATPVIIGDYIMADQVRCIRVQAKYAYLACPNYGIRIINITNPNALSEVGYYTFPQYTQSVDVRNDTIFVANFDYGITILEAYGAAGVQSIGAELKQRDAGLFWVNGTMMNYRAAAETRLKIIVYNILGQKIKTITDGWVPAGIYRAGLSGLPRGVYLATVQANGRSVCKRFVLVK